MKKFLAVILYFSSATAVAQGIKFETGNWKSVLDKAKQDKKLVYVDVYTTWCGPCKMLAAKVFPTKEAGDKYNAHFVNYRIDAEAGEGIALAKQFGVNGYPTHLFIDPVTTNVVYRDMGATSVPAEFNEHADIALQEQSDPMTSAKYAAQFKAGERSETFLRAYLTKTKRLHEPNDRILDRFVDVIATRPVVDSNIGYLLSNIQTLDNKAVPYIFANAGAAQLQTISGPGEMYSRWSYGSFENAVKTNNPVLLDSIRARTKRYTGNDDEAMDYWYRTQYYKRVGSAAVAMVAAGREADFLSGKPDSYYADADATSAANTRRSIRWQLKSGGGDTSKLDEVVEKTMQSRPEMLRGSSLSAANSLNSAAWTVYEEYPDSRGYVKQALTWSKRSLDLSNGTSSWPLFADTYAHLLYADRQKTEALKIQEEAVAKADAENRASLQESLDAMKAGTLLKQN